MLLISRHVDLEPIVHDGSDIVLSASRSEQLRGEDGKSLGIERVETPIGHGYDDVYEDDEADEDVDDGEERGHQRAAEEGNDGGPVEGEGADGQPIQAGPELLGRDRLGEQPADPRHAGDGREEVPWHRVPAEAADEHDDEELGSRNAANSAVFFLMQRSAISRKLAFKFAIYNNEN